MITVPAATTGNRTAYHVLAAHSTFPPTLKTSRGRRRFWFQIEKMPAMRVAGGLIEASGDEQTIHSLRVVDFAA